MCFSLFLAVICAVVPAPILAQGLTEQRVRGNDWWPTQGRAPRSAFAGPESCIACHAAQAASYVGAPMLHSVF